MSHVVDEYYTLYKETTPRARVARACSACREPIQVGHRYARAAALGDGSWRTIVRCLRCQKIHEHLRTIDPQDLWPDEQLNCGEEYRDHWGCDPPPEIAALAFVSGSDLQELSL